MECCIQWVQKKASQNKAMNWRSPLLLKNSIKYNGSSMSHPFCTFIFMYAITNKHIWFFKFLVLVLPACIFFSSCWFAYTVKLWTDWFWTRQVRKLFSEAHPSSGLELSVGFQVYLVQKNSNYIHALANTVMNVLLKRMRQLSQETQNKCIIDIKYSSKIKPGPAKHLF